MNAPVRLNPYLAGKDGSLRLPIVGDIHGELRAQVDHLAG